MIRLLAALFGWAGLIPGPGRLDSTWREIADEAIGMADDFLEAWRDRAR